MADTPIHCLVAHPSSRVAGQVANALTEDGWQVTHADTASAAYEQIDRPRWGILVVSSVFEQLITPERSPTIALAAPGDRPERLLDLGADAVCAAEPVRAGELRVRARALTQRACGVRVDLKRHRATLDGAELALTPKEFALLAALAASPGELVGRSALSQCLWDSQSHRPTGRALDAHAMRLKRKLGAHSAVIQTIWGLGFRFEQARAPRRAFAASTHTHPSGRCRVLSAAERR